MKKKYQIFVSSTYEDLKEERQAAVEGILEAHHIPAGMELFASSDKSQMEVIKKWIEESDIYMLILGGRYGSIEHDSDLSYIELEYNYAVEKKKPLFAIIIKNEELEKRKSEKGEKVFDKNSLDKYYIFKKVVESKMCSFFEDTKDIKNNIFKSISALEQDHEFEGWISGKDIKENSEDKAKIVFLEKENEKLKNEIKYNDVNKQNSDLIVKEYNFQELSDILYEFQIDIDNSTTNILEMFIDNQNDFIQGISIYGNANNNETLYYEVCPKLSLYNLVAKYNISKDTEYYELTDLGKIFIRKYNEEN